MGNRGAAYTMVGDPEQGLRDYKAAARMGNQRIQEALRARGIDWQQ